MEGNALIALSDVTKEYKTTSGSFRALKNVSLEVRRGEFVAIVGRSGSGKSTLINMMTGIDSPTSGEIVVDSTPIHSLDQERLAQWRGKSVGIVFQFFQLLPTLTVIENVMLPMDFLGRPSARERERRARELLGEMGVLDQADKLPSDLSGGQQQRAAIARALANDPAVVFADEPTGNLDSGSTDEVMRYFASLAAAGKTIVMVTHERDVERCFTRSISLSDGQVVDSSGATAGRSHD